MPQGAISYLNEEARLAKIKIDSDIRFQAGNMMQFRTLSKPIQSGAALAGRFGHDLQRRIFPRRPPAAGRR